MCNDGSVIELPLQRYSLPSGLNLLGWTYLSTAYQHLLGGIWHYSELGIRTMFVEMIYCIYEVKLLFQWTYNGIVLRRLCDIRISLTSEY